MRIANVQGRLAIRTESGWVDVNSASSDRFSVDPQAVYARWDEFCEWAQDVPADAVAREVGAAELGSPVPAPGQIFAIGLNYDEHAAESRMDTPTAHPPIFTKFNSCITGPVGSIKLPADGHIDWEVELVAVIGRRAEKVSAADAWSYIAGLSVGQDISERRLQLAASPPQFSLAKSYPGFGPIGPWLVTPDEFADPDNLELGCSINGETVQKGRTRDLIFTVGQLIEQLSEVLPLMPGDAIFTGTPAGVGMGREPQRWLQDGDELVSYVEGIGEMRHRFYVASMESEAVR
ncbi:fumarylacetoacetate hydrolase family protein [Rhodococcus sp. NPDC057529]|uniref:fumarylacetoacetate hydrolase family protein n=1 Tax=Rhodococcus sp. NPDC057529 TaxID=3346158 RepID=UPI00366D6B2A